MQIRILGPDDAIALQALRLQSLQECPSAFSSSYEEEVDLPMNVVAERLTQRDDRAMFGAFETGQLIGMLGIWREKHRKLAHKALIYAVYVSPAARRSGVGRQLLTTALTFAVSELRVSRVNLGVNAGNTAALALYEQLGFRQFGLERGFMFVEGELHDEISMSWVHQDA